MDPVIAQALAGLITAVATAIVMWAGYRWGGRRNGRRHKKEDNDDE